MHTSRTRAWRTTLVATILALLAPTGRAADRVDLSPAAVARPATVDEAKRLLKSRDTFVKNLSPFDRAARLKSAGPVTEKQLLDTIADQVRPFSDDEWRAVLRALTWNAEQLKRYNVPLPKEVLLIKVTGEICSDAAYTRSNAIVLPQKRLATDAKTLRKLIAHELFHIVSRHDRELRDRMYAIVGFKPVDEPTLPDWLAARKLTNPDAPSIDCFAQLKLDDREVAVVPVLYSRDDRFDERRGGSFFQYMNFALMEIKRDRDRWVVVANDEGRPKFYSPRDLPDYFKKIGRNTQYIIHPEEVLADNFKFMLDSRKELPDQRIVTALEDVFAKDANEAVNGPPASAGG